MSIPASQKIKPVMDVMDTDSEHFATIMRLTLLELRNHSPFFGVLATEMWIAGPSTSIPTIAVSPRGVVVYNDKWMRSLSVGEMIGVLIHEALHVALDYWMRFKGMDPKMSNWAHDFAINDLIKTTLPELHLKRVTVKESRSIKISLPEGGLYDPKFSNMSGEEIYVHLEKEVKAKAEQYKHHIEHALRKMAAQTGQNYDREKKIQEGLQDSMLKALKEFEAKKEEIRDYFNLKVKSKERHEFEDLLRNSDDISLTHGESTDDQANNPFADGGKNKSSNDSWSNAAPKKDDQNDSFSHQQAGDEKPEPTPEQKKLQEAEDKMVEGFGQSLNDYMEREYNRLGDVEDGNEPEKSQRDNLDDLRKDLDKHGDEYVDEVTRNGLEEEAAKKKETEEPENGESQPGDEGKESSEPGESGKSGDGQEGSDAPGQDGDQGNQPGQQPGDGQDQEGGQPGQDGQSGNDHGQSSEGGQQPGSGSEPGNQPGDQAGQQGQPGQSSGQPGQAGQLSNDQGQASEGSQQPAQPGNGSQSGASQDSSSSMPGQGNASDQSPSGGQPSPASDSGAGQPQGDQEPGQSGGSPSGESVENGAEQGGGGSAAGNQPQGQMSEAEAQNNVADKLEAMGNEMRKALRGEENNLGEGSKMGSGEQMADQDAWERAMREVGKEIGAGQLDGDIMLDDDDIPGNPFKGESPEKTQERARETLSNAVRTDKAQGGNGWGSLPAWAQDQIEGILNPPLSFDQHIKKEIGNYGARSLTTFKKPNKRNSFAPNRPLLPGKKKNESRVYILMDTSGSMFNEQDLDNLRMAYGLIKRLCVSKGLEVVVVHCDADVTKVMDTREVMKEIHSGTFGLSGKGGSDFRPGFEFIWKEIRQNDPLYGAPVIVFTDGGITVPEKVPFNVRSSTLWVTAAGERPPTKDWGTHVMMNDHDM